MKKYPTVTKMKSAFYRLSSKLDTAKERISELGDRSTESLKREKQREQRLQKTSEYPVTVEQLHKM